MKRIKQIVISFPEIKLQTRDGHKLRGFFGNYFKEYSSLLHNHFENRLLYRYPLVQYKVLNNTAYLVGLEEGADLLTKLFLRIKHIEINNQKYEVKNLNIRTFQIIIDTDNIYNYKFITLWMPLNQDNYKKYKTLSFEEKNLMLKSILIANILSFCKGIDYSVNTHLQATLNNILPHTTMFKGNTMIAFKADFKINFRLPPYIGIGKSVSRGFGTIFPSDFSDKSF